MDNLLNSLKNRLASYKAIWSKLAFDQKFSLSIMLFLLFALPVGMLLMIQPTRFFSYADFPITPPIPTVLPITPTTTVAITQTASPTLTVPPTQTPGPTIIISITPTLFPSTPTPTVIPPVNNVAPKITTSKFKSGSIGRYLERVIQAEDRNGDQVSLSVANLPTGLIFGDCDFVVRGNGTFVMSCIVKGTPTQAGIFASEFIAKDIWGVETRKIIYFTILP